MAEISPPPENSSEHDKTWFGIRLDQFQELTRQKLPVPSLLAETLEQDILRSLDLSGLRRDTLLAQVRRHLPLVQTDSSPKKPTEAA
ncbi:MAG TPA: hypothetical protein VFQ63_01810 [Patescibacteria group bacterium]|nr:hypothetical protein [Patescibacteria group bacterium]